MHVGVGNQLKWCFSGASPLAFYLSYVFVSARAHPGPETDSEYLLYCSPPWFLIQALSMNLELAIFRLAGK